MSENKVLAVIVFIDLLASYAVTYHAGRSSGYDTGYRVGYMRGLLMGSAQAMSDYTRHCKLCERTREGEE